MFNLFYAMPIGSKKFERHLTSLAAVAEIENKELTVLDADEDWMQKYVRQVEQGNVRKEPDVPCMDSIEIAWYNFYYVVVANAFYDYLDNYERKRSVGERDKAYDVFNSRCLELENGFFRKNDDLEWIFDAVLGRICHLETAEIQRSKERINAYILSLAG